MREKSSLHYYEVHAGFVHHTVNAQRLQGQRGAGHLAQHLRVPHAEPRLERHRLQLPGRQFGRIWEGRYGGVDRPVVGAHTLNYNEYSFAMSAIGNFETAQPPAAMLQAYGVLFAWKLSLHGVDAASPQQWVGSKYFQGINGHRTRRDGLPGQVPVRADPADPPVRRRRPTGLGRPRAGVERDRVGVPRPAAPQEGGRPGVRRPHQRDDPLRAGDVAGRRLGRVRPGAGSVPS
jgi:hypothetical protein